MEQGGERVCTQAVINQCQDWIPGDGEEKLLQHPKITPMNFINTSHYSYCQLKIGKKCFE